MSHPNVEFWRPMYGPQSDNGPTVGGDVIAWKRALSRAGYLPWNTFDAVYNRATVAATKLLQKDHDAITPKSGNTGIATFNTLLATHKKGSRYEWAFDPTSVHIYNDAREQGDKPTEADVAGFIVSVLWEMYDARDLIGYGQGRPIRALVYQILNPRAVKIIDCSGTDIYSQWLAGVHYLSQGITVPPLDPIYKNSGYGNTYSLAKGGMRVRESQAKIGDLAFHHNWGHVTRIVDLDPISVVSMGSNAGPLYLPLHYSPVNEIRTYPLIRS